MAEYIEYHGDFSGSQIDSLLAKIQTSQVFTSEEKTKLASLVNYDDTEVIEGISDIEISLNSHKSDMSNPHQVTKEQVGLGNVDNTADIDKPVSTAVSAALIDKVDKVSGKGLSTNDYTNTDKANLETALTKANAAAPQSTTYTKTEVDTALAAKLNTADVDASLSSTSTNPVQNKVVKSALESKQDALITDQLAAVNSGINDTKVAQIETNKNNISLLNGKIESELHALLPNITSSTTIQDYADSLSKGVYTAFIANVSNPSDSPINANCFVNIYVYSVTTAAVELIPIASNELSRTYTMRKVSGIWREWYMHEGTPVVNQ